MSSAVLKLSKTEIKKLKNYYADYLLNKKVPYSEFSAKKMAPVLPPTHREKSCFKEKMLNKKPHVGEAQILQQQKQAVAYLKISPH